METISRVLARLREPQAYQRVDTVVAIVVGGVLLIGGIAMGIGWSRLSTGYLGGDLTSVTAIVCATAQTVALAWRRTQPVVSAVVIYAAALVHYAAGAFLLPTDLLVLVALYSVTVHTEPQQKGARRAALGAALCGALMIGFLLAGGGRTALTNITALTSGFLTVAAMVFATWAIALARRGRVERLASLEERARRLELERDQQIQLATAAERTRIAREMHDVVAHSLSVVIAQADGGRYAARADAAAAERALETISTMGRDALADMRRILGVLRTENGRAPMTRPEPQFEDSDLEALAGQVRGTGMSVSLARSGSPQPLPPGMGVGVYRIVQEALTNVLKHAGPQAQVTVEQHWRPDSLILQVDDDGRGAAATSDGQGQGIVGMRERAELFGGTLVAAPRPGGGSGVRAEIPLAGATAHAAPPAMPSPPPPAGPPAPLPGGPPAAGPAPWAPPGSGATAGSGYGDAAP